MRKTLLLVTTLALLVFVNYGIAQRERLLTEGRVVLLELAPVDPRSLMQGDYMALRFAVANTIAQQLIPERAADGYAVLRLDEQNIGHFVRLDDATPIEPQEFRVRYRKRDHQVRLATNAYFFEEGTAALYEPARYGEFRVAPDGEMLLTALRDEQLNRLGPARRR